MPQINIAKIFTEYKERLVSFVRKHLTSSDDAEDVVQDIFYQLTRMSDLTKPIEQTAAWLFSVARNMIINRHKKKQDIPFSVLAAVDDETEDGIANFIDILSADETTPETEMLRSIIWEQIETAIDELPPAQRDIFIQTEFLGLPVKEISQKSGVPVNTLLSRKHYAVIYLRKKLNDLYMDFLRIQQRSWKYEYEH
ncbi:RNA polymerase sigma factor [Treponema sp. TIM-1]|uniref:RNA polymerase sigma factor n=1 Tax=Treponema sp. TIM-1 TaxID=2898417 RepID=UPI0039802F9B